MFDFLKHSLKTFSAIVFQEDAVEMRPTPDCPKEHSGDRILIRCQAIKYVIHFHNAVGGRIAHFNSCLLFGHKLDKDPVVYYVKGK